ncbi:MAG TPA: glycosyltransferase [Verrucomicrobiae bacterium]|nr:glycosyltransferase [Verrucomicrobiae bacterium]
MNEKPKVSIGIPAYNEEANIAFLLSNLLEQEKSNFALHEIIVVSDGSSDKTVEMAKSISNSVISVIENANRSGKPAVQNQILEKFTGDILVLIDGDVLPAHERLIELLVQPFLDNPKLGLVGGCFTPMPPETWVEKIISYSTGLKRKITTTYKGGKNLFQCSGRVRALSKQFGKVLKFPDVVTEDTYSYFVCLDKGFEFIYQPEAKIYYRSPQTIRDHLKQSLRYSQGKKDLEKFYSKEFIKDQHKLPFPLVSRIMVKELFSHPILLLSYLGVYLVSVATSVLFMEALLKWNFVSTSKVLIRKEKT